MKKKTLAKLAGFGIAAACTATLVGFAANGTGAYFTDSDAGTIAATSGTVTLTTSGADLNFQGVLPNEYQTQSVGFKNTGSGPEDIWLVFPAGKALTLNGPGGPSTPALGRYGHFELDSPAGNFTSYNLASDENAATDGNNQTCTPIDAQGHGGSTAQAANVADHSPLFCPVPQEILLYSGLGSGSDSSANIIFGTNKIYQTPGQEGQPIFPGVIRFSIVATQPGITPADINNSPGTPQ